jgi:hypothetical protein
MAYSWLIGGSVLLGEQEKGLHGREHITVLLPAVTGETGWHNIRQGMTATFGKRNNVILRKLLKGKFLVTVRTPIARSFAEGTPLLRRKIVNGGCGLTGTSARISLPNLVRVISTPFLKGCSQLWPFPPSLLRSSLLLSTHLFRILGSPPLKGQSPLRTVLGAIAGTVLAVTYFAYFRGEFGYTFISHGDTSLTGSLWLGAYE